MTYINIAIPSRQFMIRQSTLTAIHQCFPVTSVVEGAREAAKCAEATMLVGDAEWFLASVRRNYRSLVSQYS